jgi:hypothetical protein
MAKLSYNRKRLIVAITLVPYVLSVINLTFGLQIFGRNAKQVMAASTVVLFLVWRYFGPTLDEVREHRDAKRSAKAP